MATKTFEELKQLAIQIRDEKTNKQNTATRVGTAMLEHINKLEQDYYDKTKTDEELKERDDKLTELSDNVGLYNVDKNVPLGSGFYTSTTARNTVPSSVRKLGLIITYKTDATTSVTEQFIGSDVSGWVTDTNWKNVGSEGGNKILDWNTDVASTRKQVPLKERKAGIQISYTPDGVNWVNEQYIGTSFTDTEWVKDSNWSQLITFENTSEIELPNKIEVDAVNNFYFEANGDTQSNINYDAYVVRLNKGEAITLIGTLSIIAFAKKISDYGDYRDFELISYKDINTVAPFLSLPSYLPASNSQYGFYVNSNKVLIPPIYRISNPSDELYLLIRIRNGKIYYTANLYQGDFLSYRKTVASLNCEIDNFDFIKEKACEVSVIGDNLIDMSKRNIGFYSFIRPNDGEVIIDSTKASSLYIELEFDTQYSAKGYNFTNNGGTSGYDNASLVYIDDNGGIKNIRLDNFIVKDEWLLNDEFFSNKADFIAKKQINKSSSKYTFTFKTPKAEELNVDNIGIIINVTDHLGKPTSLDEFQFQKGNVPTDIRKEVRIFGYPVKLEDNSTDTYNYLKNKTIYFHGDSITQGTDGGYVNIVKEKTGIFSAVNYGEAGAASGRMMDIVTGLNIRGPLTTNYPSPDYSVCDAVTMMIGANGGVNGDIKKDIPSISLYDIKSYPYQYNNPGGTIEQATIENEQDYFIKVFPNTYYGNLALCVEWIKWKNPKCQVFFITTPQSDRGNHEEIRNAMIELGILLSVPVIDAQANCGISAKTFGLYTIDKTHLNTLGNLIFGSYVAKELINRFY